MVKTAKRKATKTATKQTVGKQKQEAKSRFRGPKDSKDRSDLWVTRARINNG
jgi:hypothetical protein